MSLLKRIEQDLEGLFTDAEKAVVAFADSLLSSIEKNGGSVLMSAATGAVAAAEARGGTSAEKLAAAQAAVAKVLDSQGVPLVNNAVNGAIEAAVAALPQSAATGATGAAGAAGTSGSSGGAA